MSKHKEEMHDAKVSELYIPSVNRNLKNVSQKKKDQDKEHEERRKKAKLDLQKLMEDLKA